MANLVASSVTVTVDSQQSGIRGLPPYQDVVAKLEFGDSALLYVAGGVPMDKAQFGLKTAIHSMDVFDNGISVYDYSYDKVAEKLVIRKISGTTLVEITGDAPAAQTLYVRVIGE